MHEKVQDSLRVLTAIGMPSQQCNQRSALCLLAIANVLPGRAWKEAKTPLLGITPIISFIAKHYGKSYAPNSRETIRKQTMHQFCEAGIAQCNPDEPSRPVNSPKTVYQLTPEAFSLVRAVGSPAWPQALSNFTAVRPSLREKYAAARDLKRVRLTTPTGQDVSLSPGNHSELIRQLVHVFGPRYAPGGTLIYVGDTGSKWGYFDGDALSSLGVTIDDHGKMPDAIIHYTDKNWLLLCEAVTSGGPVDGKRHNELRSLLRGAKAGLVFVTAFPTRAAMAKYVGRIAWETEVWCADAPTHLIHFNGTRFLGPYGPAQTVEENRRR